jgi:HEAT repeat protein
MTRLLPPALLALALAPAAAAQPPDLQGKTLAETFAELLPKLDKDAAAQQRWQDICFRLGAPGNDKLRAEAAALMAAKLGPETPSAARLWLLTQLERIGRDESVDALAALLDDKDDAVREAATRALANNPSTRATEKLAARLRGGAPAKAKVGLLNALGHRAAPGAEGEIARELKSDAEDVAVAAARALGRTPGTTAMRLLAAARGEAKGRARAEIDGALLAHADRMAAARETANAAAIYKMLNSADEPRPVRLAALRGVIQTAGDKAGGLVLEALAGDDAAARAVAVGQIEGLSAGALKPLAANLDTLAVPARVSVITALAARGDRSQLPVALAAARSDTAEVRRAGLLALGRLGDASAVDFLLEVMTGKDALAGVAADSLAALPAEGVDAKLIAALEGEKSAARAVALIGVLERRKAVAAVPTLLKAAGGSDPQARAAAFAALKSLAGPEHVPAMVAALLKTEKGKDREPAELAVAAVAQQAPDRDRRAGPVLAALKEGPQRTADLLPLLGRLGGPDALKLARDSVGDPALRDAAVVALCNWPDASANDDLLALAEKGKTDAEKARAIQALTRINTAPGERSPEERLGALKVMKRAMELATQDEGRRAILEGLGNVRHIETLRYLSPYLDQPALAQSACKGVVELAHSRMLREPNRAEFGKALDRVIAVCKDKGLIDRAKQYKAAP